MSQSARLVVLAGALLVMGACEININDLDDRDQDVEVSESFSFDVDLPSQTAFRLDGLNGNVVIVGEENRTAALIEGVKRVRSDSRSDAQSFLGSVDIRITTLADELRVETRQPLDLDGRNVSVDYQITLPIDRTVTVDNQNGNILVETFDRDVTIDNVNGNVDVFDLIGSALVRLTNGNIRGDVVLPVDGVVSFRTTNGNIELDIPSDVSAELNAEVTNGAISISVPGYEAVSGRRVQMTLGAGEGRIDLDTTNGNISVEGY